MFNTISLAKSEQAANASGADGTYDRTKYWYPAVAPATVSLVLHWKQCVGYSRRKVTGRVHCISSGTAKAHAERHDDRCYWPCAGCTRSAGIVCANADNHEHEDECGDNLGEEVGGLAVDGRHCAVCAKYGFLVFCCVEVVMIYEPYEDCAAETANHLCNDVADHRRCCRDSRCGCREESGESAGYGKAYGHCRVKVCATLMCHKHTRHHGETPAKGDDHPAGTLSLALVEVAGGADTISHENEDKGAEKLQGA